MNHWSNNGAPVWACVALEDALKAKALETVRDTLRDVIDGI